MYMCGKSTGPSCSKHRLLNEFIYGEHYLFKIGYIWTKNMRISLGVFMIFNIF